MTLPGVTVISRESPPSASSIIESGTWFVAGFADRGVAGEPALVRNLAQFVDEFGERVSYSTLYDALDVFFREGGSLAYVSRVVGPTPVKATVTLVDQAGSPANTLRVDAISYGVWGNDLDVVVDVTGSNFTIEVKEDDVRVEISPTLANNAEAIAWAANSSYIRLTDLGGGDPAEVTASLAGGTDDHASATDASWETALGWFPADLGPGQVSMPGRTTGQAHQDLLEHAAARNRVALLDLADTADEATLVTAAGVSRLLDTAPYGAAFAPWAVVPGIASGTTRTVPYCAVVAGQIGRNDALGLSPNIAAAGEAGISRYAVGLSQVPWTDAEREVLNNGGVNVAKLVNGQIRTYGFRSLVNPLTAAAWLQFTNGRLRMVLSAKGAAIGERFMFDQIDGRGIKMKEFEGELVAMLIPYYDSGSLYGDSPAEAFQVDTGAQVNTPETIAARELHAVMAVRMSPFAEMVEIEIVKVATTEVLA